MTGDAVDRLKTRGLTEIPIALVWNEVTGQDVSEGMDVSGVRCPFHGGGTDEHPSAKLFGSSGNSVWCWACNKKWDAIALIRQSKEIGFVDAIELLAARLPKGASVAPVVTKPKVDDVAMSTLDVL